MSINWNFELTNLALLIGAALAARYAAHQVREMRESNRKLAEAGKSQEQQLRAGVLLALDERWENPQMSAARAALHSLMKQVDAEAMQSDVGVDSIFDRHLRRLRDLEPAMYLRLFRICGFFETVGYVACADYIALQEVIDLLGPSILVAGRCFVYHIETLRAEEGQNSHLFDFFLWLLDRAKREEGRRPARNWANRL